MADLSSLGDADPPAGAPRTWLDALLVGPYRLLRGHRPLGLLVASHALSTLGAWLCLVTLAVLVFVAFLLISMIRPTVNTVLTTLVAEDGLETANSLIG